VHPVRELPSLLPAADAVVLCAPPTEETRGMFGAHRPASLKDGATLVNVGRGEPVDTDALAREVGSGRLRAALDVAALEPLPGAHPLWRQPEALITPRTPARSPTPPRRTPRPSCHGGRGAERTGHPC
jgi:phosphoglycerate dehydrogenase-like enzyme